MAKNRAFHSMCFACGPSNGHGLQLKLKRGPNGSTCTVSISPRFQSYEGVVDGGIVATLLDAAMIHTLQGHCGKDPLTCRLEIRFLRAVPPCEPLTLNTRRTGNGGRVLLADADLLCSGICYARARGAFTLRRTIKPTGIDS
jgi:acyl-coenzyme A thioesterase PaaI-like protein